MPADFSVIGCGVFGAWTALALRRRGHTVLLLDAYGAGNSRSSSGDESRIIRMGYGSDHLYTRWAARSITAWQQLFDSAQQPFFINTGVLWLSTSADAYTRLIPPVLAANGIAYEMLSPAALASRFSEPFAAANGSVPRNGTEVFEATDVDFAIFEPHSGVLLARRSVQAVASQAVRAGVEYRLDAVLPPAPSTGKLKAITTRSGDTIHAGTFIFACGAWLPQLFPALLGTRIFPTRQEVFYFGTPPGARRFKPPSMPVWLDHSNDMYGLPDIESRGIKAACDHHGEAFDPDSGSRSTTVAGERTVRDYLKRRLPQLADAPLVETRVCQYENTSNGDFLIDRHPEMENVWLVGGGSGHGFKHGPAVGEYVASVLVDRVNPEERFSVSRKLQVQQRSVY